MKLREIFLFVCIVVLILLLWKTCNVSVGNGNVTIQRDTVYITKKDTVGAYRPNITLIQGARIPQGYITRIDSFTRFEKIFIRDTVKILNDYFASVYCRDSVSTDFGSVIIQDTITENRIASRTVFTDVKIPHIKETITVQAPQRAALYFGMNALGATNQSFIGAGPSLIFKERDGKRMFQFGAYATKGNFIYQFGFHLKF